VPAPRVRLPVWPFWLAGALCEAVCVPFGVEPPIYRRRVKFFTNNRWFDISRARTSWASSRGRRSARASGARSIRIVPWDGCSSADANQHRRDQPPRGRRSPGHLRDPGREDLPAVALVRRAARARPRLEHDPDEAIVAKGRPMYPGELGCYASHYAAWTSFLESDADQLLVLEDDTIVDWGFLAAMVEVDLAAPASRTSGSTPSGPVRSGPCSRNAIVRQRSIIEFLRPSARHPGIRADAGGAAGWCPIAGASAGRSTTSSIAPGTTGSAPSASSPFL
jgi:hypothetical protein